MVDEALILAVERLRDGLGEFKSSIRSKYANAQRQVVDDKLKETAARLAETWIVNLSQRSEIAQACSSDYVADLGVHFQRLLAFSEHATQRTRYDSEINSILKEFSLQLVIPLKQSRERVTQAITTLVPVAPIPVVSMQQASEPFRAAAFVGYSFAPSDKLVVDCVIETLVSLGIKVVTGEKPRAERISDKVKRLIEDQHIFVGVFTKRDKISRKKEWTTSPWVLDEKAYALGKGKKLILLKEVGVGSIGGIQGDYEFIEFSRDTLHTVPTRLISMFQFTLVGLRT